MEKFSHYGLFGFISFLFISILCFPQAVYQGAEQGILTWANHLLPSLLPFFIIADLFISVGFVRLMGICLEPIMRPLFHLPGEAAFALALGFISGFPMGSVLTASLYEQQLCTSEEASRLVAFTNNASPLFLLIAIPITMLQQPSLGFILVAAHYGANLLIGIALGFISHWRHPYQTYSHQIHHQIPPAEQPVSFLHFPQMLSQAVQKGIKNILSIGGFVLFFSVLLSLCREVFPPLTGLFTSLLEMTLGTAYAAQTTLPLLPKLMLISFLLGWSGLSIQAQVLSILAPQHISGKLYLLCRPVQGILAALLVPLLLTLFPALVTVGNDFALMEHSLDLRFQLPLLTLSLLTLLIFPGLLYQKYRNR